MIPAALPPAGLLRRLLAASYDALLLIALYMVATVPLLLLTGGEAIPAGHPLYLLYLLLLGQLFFGYFWTRRGQTLGMQTWRIRLVNADGGPCQRRQAVRRYFGALLSWALLGTGFLLQLIDRDGLSLHDRLSGTRIVRLPPHRR